MAIPLIKTRLPVAAHRRVAAPPKVSAAVYHTDEYKRWRLLVIERAGGRCEAMTAGGRCSKAQPRHRMFADHIKELRDGGAPFDPANGQCLCGSHHTAKTAEAKGQRRFV
jgi:hypothetical protein